ncbi:MULTISPECIES: hydrogen peroxide-inducible genes activator [unclassified Salinivibrio]|uniref:hydrogen peroxide-inducible genes activator n=1 Tax=unclassified Salinivibrio TaxID=2636825 RepID=UPI00128E0181|nr:MULTISPECIES: hydrogen peroxide-inducible genes activator [unclassified Salinivibrio]MPS33030.1 hydrogen peroxide-inducible genes activator [Salinivibrio sp. VYel7]MPX94416.1 hydrogen peroxide-inducible genes activator [Salinivibrio sp. VYel9]MPX96320.1 hydrogen peroxide-inducible genes activator [Salinivibrio sp. VYel6]MPY00702.1 hydrogen peroxide-inducible genes activator [Salinivibrio sp. VYel4]MPY03715.1 hydrogen peroxide-inducible genes activator [Salinivibrio sp. VYel5]
MNKYPSLKQLHYLVTLSETRHFGEAAKLCFVSQSTLSAGIQNLEDLIGAQLIERDNKTLVLTGMGEEVVRRSREILARSQDLMELTQVKSDPMHGKVRLGCIPTIAPFLLCDVVQQVNRHYPNLDLLLREDTTANLLTALKHGEMDTLILALPMDIGTMTRRVVGRDPFKMVMSQKQAAQLELPIDYDALPDESVFLLEREHCLTDHAVSACQMTASQKINPFMATSLHTLVQMVANGNGVTFIPQMAIDHGLIDNLDVHLETPPGEAAYRDIGVVWRPSSSRINTFNQLADLVAGLLSPTARE